MVFKRGKRGGIKENKEDLQDLGVEDMTKEEVKKVVKEIKKKKNFQYGRSTGRNFQNRWR